MANALFTMIRGLRDLAMQVRDSATGLRRIHAKWPLHNRIGKVSVEAASATTK